MKITNRIVDAYLGCKYKAHLLLNGETGTPHDYELLMEELQAEYRPKATDHLLRGCKLASATSIAAVASEDLRQGHPLILNCTVETEQIQFGVDALRQVDGNSSLGPFYYLPVCYLYSDDYVFPRTTTTCFIWLTEMASFLVWHEPGRQGCRAGSRTRMFVVCGRRWAGE